MEEKDDRKYRRVAYFFNLGEISINDLSKLSVRPPGTKGKDFHSLCRSKFFVKSRFKSKSKETCDMPKLPLKNGNPLYPLGLQAK